MIIKLVELFLLLTFAVYFDIKIYKIKNYITYPAILTGLITNFILSGFTGLIDSLAGTIIPIIILFIFYMLRMLGAGDLKLFGAIGAVMGFKFILCSMVYSFIFGGIIAAILIIIRKNAVERFKHLLSYLKSCFLMLKLEKYQEFDNNKGLFRFSYAICGGTLIAALDGFFVHFLQGI